jgi:hypothetical protein
MADRQVWENLRQAQGPISPSFHAKALFHNKTAMSIYFLTGAFARACFRTGAERKLTAPATKGTRGAKIDLTEANEGNEDGWIEEETGTIMPEVAKMDDRFYCQSCFDGG